MIATHSFSSTFFSLSFSLFLAKDSFYSSGWLARGIVSYRSRPFDSGYDFWPFLRIREVPGFPSIPYSAVFEAFAYLFYLAYSFFPSFPWLSPVFRSFSFRSEDTEYQCDIPLFVFSYVFYLDLAHLTSLDRL